LQRLHNDLRAALEDPANPRAADQKPGTVALQSAEPTEDDGVSAEPKPEGAEQPTQELCKATEEPQEHTQDDAVSAEPEPAEAEQPAQKLCDATEGPQEPTLDDVVSTESDTPNEQELNEDLDDGANTEESDSDVLAEKMVSRRRFGAIDHSIVQRNSSFDTAGRTAADHMAGGIEKRVSKLLDLIGDASEEDDGPPRLRTQEENKELIVSKIT